MPPLLRVLASQPRLLADHAEAYVDLLAEETHSAAAAWAHRLWWAALSLCAGAVAGVLAGVAAMLWVVLPQVGSSAAWLLLATPMVPLFLALWALHVSRAAAAGPVFSGMREQLRFDMDMLRETRSWRAP